MTADDILARINEGGPLMKRVSEVWIGDRLVYDGTR